MRTTAFILAAASALAFVPSFAQEATTDQLTHQGAPSTMTRDQFLANEAAQTREMIAKGMQWNQLYSRWDWTDQLMRGEIEDTLREHLQAALDLCGGAK